MAKNPDERYPTCTDFSDAIRSALGLGAYTTPSSAYTTAAGTGLPPALGGEPAGPAAAVLPVPPVPASTLSVPPAATDTVPPSLEAAVLASLAQASVPTQSGSSLGFADTTGQSIAAPGGSPAPGSSPHRAVRPAGRRQLMIAATAVVVAAGGLTVAFLEPWSHNSAAPGASQSASQLPPSQHATLLAVLTEPRGAAPGDVGFKSDIALVTVDPSFAYSWDIPSARYTAMVFRDAVAITSAKVKVAGTERVEAGISYNEVQVRNTATGQIVALMAAPSGTTVQAFALSPDGTEAAAADDDGNTYVWKLAL
jgi:hypothetical protein